MLLQVGTWFTEEWVEQWGPRLLDLGFSAVGMSTDTMSPGLYGTYRLEYTADEPLTFERLVEVLRDIKAEMENAGQTLEVSIVRKS